MVIHIAEKDVSISSCFRGAFVAMGRSDPLAPVQQIRTQDVSHSGEVSQ